MNLRQYVKRAGGYESAARELGLNPRTLRRLVAGESRRPHPGTVRLLADRGVTLRDRGPGCLGVAARAARQEGRMNLRQYVKRAGGYEPAARELGLNPLTLRRLVAGESRRPHPGTVRLLADRGVTLR